VTGRLAATVLVLASAVVLAAIGWVRHTERPPAAANVRTVVSEESVIRGAAAGLQAFEVCLRNVGSSLPASLGPTSMDATGLVVVVDGASERLAGCQNDELAAVAEGVGALRAAAPWSVVHAAALAQADGQQAGLSLGQLLLLLRHVTFAGGRDRLPRGTAATWTTFERSFRVSIVRMNRRRHELGLALAAVQGSS
jgi:hypothetical protein